MAMPSLGWPTPRSCQLGMAYAQVLVEGYRMVLEANGKAYEYHTSMDRVVLRGPGPAVGTVADGSAVGAGGLMAAGEDLRGVPGGSYGAAVTPERAEGPGRGRRHWATRPREGDSTMATRKRLVATMTMAGPEGKSAW